jgi:hypothetical protein
MVRDQVCIPVAMTCAASCMTRTAGYSSSQCRWTCLQTMGPGRLFCKQSAHTGALAGAFCGAPELRDCTAAVATCDLLGLLLSRLELGTNDATGPASESARSSPKTWRMHLQGGAPVLAAGAAVGHPPAQALPIAMHECSLQLSRHMARQLAQQLVALLAQSESSAVAIGALVCLYRLACMETSPMPTLAVCSPACGTASPAARPRSPTHGQHAQPLAGRGGTSASESSAEAPQARMAGVQCMQSSGDPECCSGLGTHCLWPLLQSAEALEGALVAAATITGDAAHGPMWRHADAVLAVLSWSLSALLRGQRQLQAVDARTPDGSQRDGSQLSGGQQCERTRPVPPLRSGMCVPSTAAAEAPAPAHSCDAVHAPLHSCAAVHAPLHSCDAVLSTPPARRKDPDDDYIDTAVVSEAQDRERAPAGRTARHLTDHRECQRKTDAGRGGSHELSKFQHWHAQHQEPQVMLQGRQAEASSLRSSGCAGGHTVSHHASPAGTRPRKRARSEMRGSCADMRHLHCLCCHGTSMRTAVLTQRQVLATCHALATKVRLQSHAAHVQRMWLRSRAQHCLQARRLKDDLMMGLDEPAIADAITFLLRCFQQIDDRV